MSRVAFGRVLKNLCRTMSSEMGDSLIAVCQMRSVEDKEVNWRVCADLMKKAKAGNAKMVFFPECFDYIASSRVASVANATSEDDEYIGRFRTLARELGVWLSLGGFHEKCESDPEHVYNAHLIIDSQGKTVFKYRKLHLFDVDIPNQMRVMESSYSKAGDAIPNPVSTPVGRLFPSICYDMRFPELCRLARRNGAELLTYPSAFTLHTGLAHWEVLLRSRAIDYQCYVVAAAQYGKHNDRRSSFGHAMVVDPWGTVVAQCSNSEPAICFANVNLEYLQTVRQVLPVVNHLRNDLYLVSLVSTQPTAAAADPDSRTEEYKFAEKVIPNSCVFYLSSLSYAFVNRKPVVEGHVLVAPLRIVSKLTDVGREELADLFQTAQAVQRALERFYGLTSSTICVQDGSDAGQSVPHVHVHVLPRRKGDFALNDEVYSALQKHDKGDSQKDWRSLEEMEKEALMFRQLFALA